MFFIFLDKIATSHLTLPYKPKSGFILQPNIAHSWCQSGHCSLRTCGGRDPWGEVLRVWILCLLCPVKHKIRIRTLLPEKSGDGFKKKSYPTLSMSLTPRISRALRESLESAFHASSALLDPFGKNNAYAPSTFFITTAK